MTRQRWMFILDSIFKDRDYTQTLWRLNEKDRAAGPATSLDDYWQRLIDIQEYIRHRRLNDANATSTVQVLQLKTQMSKLEKQISSIQTGSTVQEIAATQLAKDSAKQHKNWKKPCVLCNATDCVLCTRCFKFASCPDGARARTCGR